MASHGANASANRLARWAQDNRVAVAAVAVGAAVASAAGVYYYSARGGAPPPRGGGAPSAGDERAAGAGKKKRMKRKGKTSNVSKGGPGGPGARDGPILDDADDASLAGLDNAALARLPDDRRASVAQHLKAHGNKAYSDKKYDQAVEHYTRAIAAQPSAVFYSNRAACHSNMGNPEAVIGDCDEALKIDRTYVKALNRRAVAEEALGDACDATGPAGDAARESLTRSLADFTAVAILGQFRDSSATASVERVLKKLASGKAQVVLKTREPRLPSPTFVTAYLEAFRPQRIPEIPADAPQGDRTLALAYEALGARDYAHALTLFTEAVGQGLGTPELETRARNMRATFLFVIGLAQKALEDLDRCTELCPDDVQSWVKKASVHMELGDKEAAFRDFDRATAANADDPDIYYHRGQVQFILGNYDAAIVDYEKSTELDGTFIFSQVQNAVAHYKLGNLARSTAAFRRILKTFSDSAEAYNYYGELLLDQQRYEDAVANFDKSIALEKGKPGPSNVLPMINKALVLFQWKQDLSGAEALCREALAIDPDCDVAIATLAQLSLQQSKIPDAIEYFRRSAEIARTEPELVNAITYEHASRAQLQFIHNYPEQGAALSQMASSLM
ncbi:TOM (translocase of outer membrane) complex component [Malassezia sp. CBS 17886]|nr:TOM (translocase of outer membrane) complex component [Malassezia sp. CBS 17886]